jgi:AcrR family transcriptional regulator
MGSSSSDTSAPVARQPKRERGRQRVEALLDAAAAIFMERGMEAATMTEIAARAGASIGSLYQFFPNKLLLAEALRERFVAKALGVFEALAASTQKMGADELALALIEYIHAIERDRAVMLTLSDVRNEHDSDRVRTRVVLTQGLGRALCAHAPALDEERATHCARLILYLLRLVTELPHEAQGESIEQELRGLLRTYLSGLGV